MDDTPITPISVGSNSDTIHENLNFQGLENIDISDAIAPTANQRTATRRRAVPWTIKDECLLAVSYLNITKDKIVGNSQSGSEYWKRITTFYNENTKDDQVERGANQCKQNWYPINQAVGKFKGCYAKYDDRSGFNESMKLTEAQSLYEEMYGKTFNFMHVYDFVSKSVKWTDENRKNKEVSGHSSKRNKTSVSGEYTSSGGDVSVTEERSEIRPTGRDAAKKAQARKGKGQMSENDYSGTMSMAKNIEETRAMSASRLADIKEQEIEERLICADVNRMTPLQRKLHQKKLEEIAAKRGINIDDFS
ncbi:hypothetical protein RND81_11G192200 [Saponaria officinalis]|uniref:No apical meristem-associated C-terminal domain-containing protein n=1 Tax=Saponaria officinalis TaxID=3572 RepID=A0AAW1HP54_SAPOF